MNLYSLLRSEGVDLDALPFESAETAPRQQFQFATPYEGQRLRAPADFDKVFQDAGDAYGVDPYILKSIAFAESRFNPDIISGKVKSPAGAIGLMQFMPDTAKEYDIDPTNPVEAIFGAAAYMRQSLDKFDGDYGKAVASYNAGRNRKSFDSEDWDLKLPAETQKYMQTVFSAVTGFKDGGAEVPTPPAKVPDTGDETARLAARYKAPVRERTWGEAVSDTLVQLGEGSANLVGAIPNLVAPDSDVARAIKDVGQGYRDKQSEALKQRSAMANQAIDKAGEDGIIAQVVEAAKQYSSDPVLAARFVTTNLPSMIPGIGAAKLAQAAALARGATAAQAIGTATTAAGGVNAAMNAGGARGEAFDDLKQAWQKQGKTEEDATQLALSGSRLPAAVGAVAGFVSGKTGLEGAIVGKVGAKAALASGTKAFAAEQLGEQVEEIAPKLATNYQGAQADGRSLGKDVGRTIVETAIGAGPGSIVSGVQGAMNVPTVESQPTTPQAPQVNTSAADTTKAQAVDDIAAAILEAEGNAPSATQATPVQPGSQAADAGAAAVAQGNPGAAEGSGNAGAVDVAGQSESAQSLTIPEKGSAVIPSVETGQSMVQRLTKPATPEQEQAQADTVVTEQAKPAPAYTPAIPQPGQAESIIAKAKESAAKHADLADERMYSMPVLQRIAEHPQANAELKAAATREVARRTGIERQRAETERKRQEAARSGTVLTIPDRPTDLRPLSVERGIEIAKASRERQLLPQEVGYMDALKAEIGDKAFDLVQRAGKAPFMTTMSERKFDLPRLLEQNQSAISAWDSANNPAPKATEAPQAAQTPAPAPTTGLAAEMAAIKAKAQPAVKMDIGRAVGAAQAPAVAPVVSQQMTTEAAPVAKQGKKQVTQPVASQAESSVAATHSAPEPYVQELNAEVPAKAPDQNPSKETLKAARSIPTFQGGKTKMARAITEMVRKYWGGNAAKIDTIVDYFGGSGSWGAYMASSVFTNTKSLIIHEYNPERLAKIKLFNESGDKIAAMIQNPKVVALFDKIKQVIQAQETFSGSAIAGVVANRNAYKELIAQAEREFKPDQLNGLLQAIEDQGQASFGMYGKGKSGAAAVDDILKRVSENGAQAHAQMSALRARGVTISYVTGDSYQAQQVQGKNVLAMVDPPYYATKGYNGVKLVPIETYNDTRKLLDRLRRAGNSVIYTDEAWWEKHDKNTGKTIVPPDVNKVVDGLDAFGQLRGIQSLMGNFFRMPIATRMEVVGFIDGNQNAGTVTATTPTDAGKNARRDVRQDAGGVGSGTGQQAGGDMAARDGRVPQGQNASASGIKASRAAPKLRSVLGYFDYYPVAYPIGYAEAEPRTVEVGIADIVPTQDSLMGSAIDKMAAEPDARLPEVVRDDSSGRYILLDGHHRIAAAIQNGEDSVTVTLVGTTPKATAFSGFKEDMQADWRASNPEQSERQVMDVVTGEMVGQGSDVRRSQGTQAPRTPISTITEAITKAYGNALTRLQGKGLVTLTQTEDEALRAAAAERAKVNGTSEAVELKSLRASVNASQRAPTPSEAFGREVAPLAIKAYKSLSVRAKGIVDGWNFNWSSGQGKLRDNEYFDEVVKAYEPVREKLRQMYGDTVPAYRGQKNYDKPSSDDRFLFSWSPLRDVATEFAINRRGGLPPEITQKQVDDQIEAYRKTGIARLNGYKFVRKDPGEWTPDGPDYYYIYRRGEMQTDGDDIARALQMEKSERDGYIAELQSKGKLYTAQLPVDSIAFIPVGVNLTEPEFVAEYNPNTDDATEIDIKRSADGKLQGFHDPATGKSFLISDNLTAETAPGVFMHEVGIHMANDGTLQPVFDRASALVTDPTDPFLQRVKDRMDTAGETSGEEAAAYIVEEYERDRTNAPASVTQWFKGFVADVRAWLFKQGVLIKDGDLKPADIAAIARANVKAMAKQVTSTPYGDNYADLKGDVTYEVPTTDGKTVKVTTDARKLMRQYDQRLSALENLRNCL